jgi:DNA-binding response OmpR family regulator
MDRKKVLVVDDESRCVFLLSANLKSVGYEVYKASNGEEAIQVLINDEPDIILLDAMMPVMDGFKALEKIRTFSRVPIIMVTAMGEEHQRIDGLNMGADDYITKPFSADELLARVNAVLRRSDIQQSNQSNKIFKHGDLTINLERAEVWRGEEQKLLSSTEYRLLLMFVNNIGKVLSSEDLLTSVWGNEYQNDREILWVCISRLRQKLEQNPKDPQHITTRSGMGYMMPQESKQHDSL